MKLVMFSVYDSKVEAWMPPFFMRSKGEALRAWSQTVNDGQSAMSHHPADFSLMEIGNFDDENGKVLGHTVPVSLGTGLEFKKLPSEQLPLEKVISMNKGV